MIDILTQNCLGPKILTSKKRFKTIREEIEKTKPDFVFLQEVTFRFQLRLIKPKNYQAFYKTRWFLVKSGLLTLIRDDLVVENSGFTKYSSQGRLLSKQLFDRLAGKGFLVTNLRNGLLLINTHLLATHSKKFVNDKNQKHQLKELIEYIKRFKKVIAAGDFNFDEDSQFYKKLLEQCNLRDLTYGIGDSSLNNPRKLDFVFAPKNSPKARKVNFVDYNAGNYPSDHKGLFVELN